MMLAPRYSEMKALATPGRAHGRGQSADARERLPSGEQLLEEHER